MNRWRPKSEGPSVKDCRVSIPLRGIRRDNNGRACVGLFGIFWLVSHIFSDNSLTSLFCFSLHWLSYAEFCASQAALSLITKLEVALRPFARCFLCLRKSNCLSSLEQPFCDCETDYQFNSVCFCINCGMVIF